MSIINKSRKQKKINSKFNKTKKNKNIYRGGKTKNDAGDVKKREGIMDYMGDKMGDLASDSVSFLTNKTARLFGFKPINAAEEKEDQKEMATATKSVSDTASNISNSISNVATGISNSVNEGTASMISDVNDVIDAPVVSDTVSQAADDTKEITEGLLENVNETFDDPEFKKELGKTLENTAEIATISIKAMDKPIDEAIDKVNDATGKAIGGIAGTGIKVATDMMAAVPYLGAVVEMGKIVNDTSKGVSAVVEAGSEIAETSSDLVTDSIENFKDEYKKAEDLKDSINEKSKITDRVNDSIDDFEKTTKNPKEYLKGGGKTRKHSFKRKGKSKRVRFAI
jgi:DNA-binding ferritin-like protein (Dps family)